MLPELPSCQYDSTPSAHAHVVLLHQQVLVRLASESFRVRVVMERVTRSCFERASVLEQRISPGPSAHSLLLSSDSASHPDLDDFAGVLLVFTPESLFDLFSSDSGLVLRFRSSIKCSRCFLIYPEFSCPNTSIAMDHYKEARNKFRLAQPHPSSPTRRRIPLPTPSATQHALIPLLPSLYNNNNNNNTQNANPDLSIGQPTARQLGQQRRRERERQEKLQKHKVSYLLVCS